MKAKHFRKVRKQIQSNIADSGVNRYYETRIINLARDIDDINFQINYEQNSSRECVTDDSYYDRGPFELEVLSRIYQKYINRNRKKIEYFQNKIKITKYNNK